MTRSVLSFTAVSAPDSTRLTPASPPSSPRLVPPSPVSMPRNSRKFLTPVQILLVKVLMPLIAVLIPVNTSSQSISNRAVKPSAPRIQGSALPSKPMKPLPMPLMSLSIQLSSSSSFLARILPFSACSSTILIMYSSMVSRSESFLEDSMVAFLTSSASSVVKVPLAEPMAEIPDTMEFAKSSASVMSSDSRSFLLIFRGAFGTMSASGESALMGVLIGLVPGSPSPFMMSMIRSRYRWTPSSWVKMECSPSVVSACFVRSAISVWICSCDSFICAVFSLMSSECCLISSSVMYCSAVISLSVIRVIRRLFLFRSRCR